MGYKIMIVEDDFSLASAMKEQIEAWGYEVNTVNNFQKVKEEFVDGNQEDFKCPDCIYIFHC